MKLCYYPEKNFGDSLNGWLWEKLIPGVFDKNEKIAFVGIGTLINDILPRRTRKADKRVIFGTGVGYGEGLPSLDDSYKIYCVRGPLSAKALGISDSLAVTDGALLIRKIFNDHNQKLYKYSYMPHFQLAGEGWRLACKKIGFGYIDPRWEIEKILSSISQTEVLITEAMHGAIVADALRIPWIPVITNSHILQFKWLDWCGSINVEYKPTHIERLHHPREKIDLLTASRLARDWVRQKKAGSQLLGVAKTIHPNLSSDRQIEKLTSTMDEKLQQFQDSIKAGDFS